MTLEEIHRRYIETQPFEGIPEASALDLWEGPFPLVVVFERFHSENIGVYKHHYFFKAEETEEAELLFHHFKEDYKEELISCYLLGTHEQGRTKRRILKAVFSNGRNIQPKRKI